MQSNFRPEGFDVSPVLRSRSVSISSDAAQPKALILSPPPADPPAAFIAASAASQIVSAELEQNEMIPGDGEDVSVAPGSLTLLNAFLDHLLFNILVSAKSTQLTALRPAIADVLKPRLAKEVVSAADEELGEYMGGGEDEELQEFRGGQEPKGEFDLVRAWKLTRLRCMVYTRLGDLEEEEEDEYIAREGLDEAGGAPRRFSSHAGNITPAAAIFLTSIIEYLGEHALVIAGENARNRLYSARINTGQSHQSETFQLTVEESDMEKLALNATLGRLWRTWRKRVRGPTLSRTISRDSFPHRGMGSRKSSIGNAEDLVRKDLAVEQSVEEDDEERVDPTTVALPMTANDVNEIEVPGLWIDTDEVQTMQAVVAQKMRPRSLMVSSTGLLTPTSSTGGSPKTWSAGDSTVSRHNRSRSLPSQTQPVVPSADVDDEASKGEEFATPPEERRSLETMYEKEENEETEGGMETETPSAPSEVAASDTFLQSGSETNSPKDSVPGLRALDQTTDKHPGESRENPVKQGNDRQEDEADVLEGQGTYEIPKLASLPAHRPNRKPSKETTRRENRTTYILENREVAASYRVDPPPSMQGAGMMRDPVSTTLQQNGGYQDDRYRPSAARHANRSISSGTVPTSHPRQLEPTLEVSAPVAGDMIETADDVPRTSLTTSRHASSHYSESIGAPISTSDENESVYRSRTPSRAASQAASLSGQHRQNQGDHSPGLDRAAVQRVLVPSVSQVSTNSRRSESISDKRPLTSGSATSTVSTKLKGLIGRHPADVDVVPLPPRRRRSSEATRQSSTSDVVVDDRSDLDKLIKSNETLHYTLTPRSMRAMEVPASPRWNTARTADAVTDRPDTSELAEFLKNTAPPGNVPSPQNVSPRDLPSPRMPPSSPSMNGLRAHPAKEPARSIAESPNMPPPASPSSQRSDRSMYQARDARTPAESTRDFADFIRSTGPPTSMRGAAVVSTERPARTHYRDGSGSMVDSTRPDTSRSTSSRATAQRKESQDSPKRNGPRLQARAPVANEGNQTSDLIDFIREGPPAVGGHRIPRTVAPFRTTMDSDQLLAMDIARIDKDIVATVSNASTRGDSTQPDSLRSSANSRAPLLEAVNRSNGPQGPVRKQRRVKDPYAIDYSDDEDLDELVETPKPKPKPQREEESLMDFLRSVTPPPESDVAPVPFSINTMPPKSSNGSTASGIVNRFRRNTSVDKTPLPKRSMGSIRSAKAYPISSPVGPPVPQSPSLSSTSSRSKINGQSNNYASGRSGYPAHVSRERGPVSQTATGGPRPPRAHTETGALADFLMNTGPPEPPVRPPSVISEDRKDSTFSRFFRRGKRVEV